jgi:glycosyltransferase involved in cell wall biosynthesis
MNETLDVRPPVLRPGIDLDLFTPREKKPGMVRIAFMPRKNKALVERIRDTFGAMAADLGERVEWVSIQGMDAAGVAGTLGRCHIFLATGFPEGCPLPPLEAMACGCLVVGFGGLGGFDYMRGAADFPGAFTPWWPLREVKWGGNGLFCADADVPAAANGLRLAVDWWLGDRDRALAVTRQGLQTAQAYGLDNQAAAVREYFSGLEQV